MSAPTLVVGATGALGLDLCRELSDTGRPVRGLVREDSDPGALAELEGIEVEPVIGDLKDPVSLERAVSGVASIVASASATIPFHSRHGDTIESVDRRGMVTLIEAAEAEGIERFLFISSNSRDRGPATLAKRAVEDRLAAGSVPFTVLRPCRFMEVWFGPALGFDHRLGKAEVLGSGNAPVSWISRRDVPAFARLCAADPDAEGETIELGGPEALSQREAIAAFERASSIRFEVEVASAERLHAELASATDPLQASYAAFKLDTAAGNAVDMDATLRRYPVDLTSVEDFAAQLHRSR